MGKKYKLCLSTIVEATGSTLPDEAALQRLQEAFTLDDGRRYSLHAEVIAYHLQQLLKWALHKGPPARLRTLDIGIDASDEHTDRILLVDCLLTVGDDDASSS